MKFPPASAKASKILRLSSLEAPQPQTSPNVIVPRHSSETCNPLGPNNLYFISLSIDLIPESGQRVDLPPALPLLHRLHAKVRKVGIEHSRALLGERRAAVVFLFPHGPA